MNNKNVSKFLDTSFGLLNVFGLIAMVAQNLIVAQFCFILASVAASLWFYWFKAYTGKDAVWMGVFWILLTGTVVAVFAAFMVHWLWLFVAAASLTGCFAIVNEDIVSINTFDEDEDE